MQGQQDKMAMIAAQYQQQMAQMQMAQAQAQMERQDVLSRFGGQIAPDMGLPAKVGEALGPTGVFALNSQMNPPFQPYTVAEMETLPDGKQVEVKYEVIDRQGTKRPVGYSGVGGSAVTVNMPSEMGEPNQFDMSPVLQDEYKTYRGQAVQARKTLPMLDRFEAVNQLVDTGQLKPATTRAKAILKGFGIEPESLGLTDDVASAEALRNLGTNFAMQFIQQTKGAISDREMGMFLEASPNLSNTPQGNRLITNFMRKSAENQIAVNRLLNEHIRENKGWDVNKWEQELAEFHADNPVFTEEDMKILGLAIDGSGGALPPPPDQSASDEEILEYYRRVAAQGGQ
jgi:hypothetical protein